MTVVGLPWMAQLLFCMNINGFPALHFPKERFEATTSPLGVRPMMPELIADFSAVDFNFWCGEFGDQSAYVGVVNGVARFEAEVWSEKTDGTDPFDLFVSTDVLSEIHSAMAAFLECTRSTDVALIKAPTLIFLALFVLCGTLLQNVSNVFMEQVHILSRAPWGRGTKAVMVLVLFIDLTVLVMTIIGGSRLIVYSEDVIDVVLNAAAAAFIVELDDLFVAAFLQRDRLPQVLSALFGRSPVPAKIPAWCIPDVATEGYELVIGRSVLSRVYASVGTAIAIPILPVFLTVLLYVACLSDAYWIEPFERSGFVELCENMNAVWLRASREAQGELLAVTCPTEEDWVARSIVLNGWLGPLGSVLLWLPFVLLPLGLNAPLGLVVADAGTRAYAVESCAAQSAEKEPAAECVPLARQVGQLEERTEADRTRIEELEQRHALEHARLRGVVGAEGPSRPESPRGAARASRARAADPARRARTWRATRRVARGPPRRHHRRGECCANCEPGHVL